MATTDQPLKKRKLYNTVSEESPTESLIESETTVAPPTPPPLSQDEIIAKRRNRDEIRNVYDIYRRLKACVSQKFPRNTADVEQAYRSLIMASRGCTSVQCIVADLIPRYASYCPTAIEAATKVLIDMHNWNATLVKRGDDYDGVAGKVAMSCIFGLGDICHTASSELIASTVLCNISAAVFRNVLSFFVSSLEGRSIYQIDKEILKMHGSPKLFPLLKHKFVDEDGSLLVKLSKIRALSLLHIFFVFPKTMLIACFDLICSNSVEGIREGKHFLRQVTDIFEDNVVPLHMGKTNDEDTLCQSSIRPTEDIESQSEELTDGTQSQGHSNSVSKNCLLQLVLLNNESLRSWMYAKYKKSRNLPSLVDASDIQSALDRIFESFSELNLIKEHIIDNDDDQGPVTHMDLSLPTFQASLSSPQDHVRAPAPEAHWLCEGDPAALDIFPASRLLWLGSLAPDFSEGYVRSQLEKFGPMDYFLFVSSKRFSIVEYRYMVDAVQAREYVWSHFSWQIKFMDSGLGTKGVINGSAVGSSCHVYVGHISSQWERDEILLETRKSFQRGPYMITERSNEGALLLEFETPEAATIVMTNLRLHRKEKNYQLAWRQADASTSMPVPIHTDIMTNNPGGMCSSSAVGSCLSETVPENQDNTRMSNLSSLLASLRAKYNINPNPNHFSNTTEDADQVPSTTLWIYLPNFGSPCLTDDELMTLCKTLIVGVGSIIRMTRANALERCGWFVECSNLDAAATVLKGFRGCPETFFQIEFSHLGLSQGIPLSTKPECSSLELISPRVMPDNQSTPLQAVHPFGLASPAQKGGHVPSYAMEQQMWMYPQKDNEQHPQLCSSTCLPVGPQPPILPPMQPQHQLPPFLHPVCAPPSNSWDPRSVSHNVPLNPDPTTMVPNGFQGNVAAPFVPASVTPLSQVQQPQPQHIDHMLPLPSVPPPPSCLPPQPEVPPPLPPSPQAAPPPPSSPPPLPPVSEELPNMEGSKQLRQYKWQGNLSKSGVHYCTIYAHKLDSEICKYPNFVSEPAEWPAKLDMTKRTDFRHVKSTFTGTPLHKREVCCLTPATASDQKGFQDFILYLKQRECAGVIKIPAMKSMWTRLLFILPYSADTCSMLSIVPDTSNCLIALVLPKETNFEWV